MSIKKSRLEAIIVQISDLVREAYQQGGADQIDALLQAAATNKHVANQPTPYVKEYGKSTSDSSATLGYRRGTVVEQVHKLIQEKPGMTGAQIISEINARLGPTPDKTVRTSLARLKTKWGKPIINRGGHWYPNSNSE